MRERARGRPAMTEDQRMMAVTLLANAIRKEEHLSARSRRYVQGMRDLLAVLFAGGRAEADECYEAARAQARGEQTRS